MRKTWRRPSVSAEISHVVVGVKMKAAAAVAEQHRDGIDLQHDYSS